jgi:hypothetical protein
MQQRKILSTSNTISPQQERTGPSGHRLCRRGVMSSLRREPDALGDLLRALFGNVTEPGILLSESRGRTDVTNEAFARVRIDQLLKDTEWKLTDGRSVRFEYPLDDGGKDPEEKRGPASDKNWSC